MDDLVQNSLSAVSVVATLIGVVVAILGSIKLNSLVKKKKEAEPDRPIGHKSD